MKTTQFDPLDYAASVRHAIARSISHTEIVRTPVPAQGRAQMIDYLENQTEIEELDSSDESDGSLDVYGKFKGDDFRILLTTDIKVGDRVEAGDGEDHDTGRVDAIEGDTATVSWDSHVVTTSPVNRLSKI